MSNENHERRTLYQKIWDDHVILSRPDGTALIAIDRHLIHEVTTPQAFDGLRAAGRRVYRPDLTLAVADHNVPTINRHLPNLDPQSAKQLAALDRNCAEFDIEQIALSAAEQGIVHVVGPEQGFTLPGLTMVCGDSHTATHGALGALAFGIGTSEIEHVFATQTLLLRQSRTMEVRIDGALGLGVRPKDVTMAVVAALGTAGGTGHVIEYTGDVMRAMSIEGRLTICNMAIEAGARAGLVAPDDITYAYLKGRPRAPRGDGMGPGRRILAHVGIGSRCTLRPIVKDQRQRPRPASELGNEPRRCGGNYRESAGPRELPRSGKARSSPALPRLHGPEAGNSNG